MNEKPKFWIRLKLKIQYYNNKLDTFVEKFWEKLKRIWDEVKPYVFGYVILAIIVQVYVETDLVIQFNQVSYLQNRDGVVYEVNSDSKFTGKYVDTYGKKLDCSGVSCLFSKKQTMEEVIFRDGVRDGGYTYWYSNGQKMIEGSYEEGKKDGEWRGWYENGKKEFERYYKDGKEVSSYEKESLTVKGSRLLNQLFDD